MIWDLIETLTDALAGMTESESESAAIELTQEEVRALMLALLKA